MRTAELIKDNLTNFNGHAALYKLSQPVSYGYDDAAGTTEFVVASTADVMFSGVETYLFPADAEGNILNWGELDGSMKGETSHEVVLGSAGFTLKEAA